MKFQDKLPVSYLLLTARGRISRLAYWTVSLFIWTSFYVLYNILGFVFSHSATFALYPLLFWTLIATGIKRLHDQNKSGYWWLAILVPVAGPLLLIYLLGFRRGSAGSNRYGSAPGSAPDYFKNPDAEIIPHLKSGERIVNDITRLNPVLVAEVERPESVEQLQAIIKNAGRPVSVGGGRFSMGGQTASTNSLHIDMRGLNKVIAFSGNDKTIKVQAGIRWCDIQRYVDAHGLSVKIMQTYANFTVGGALSVNVHGRYMGLGPLILSVRSLDVVLANGDLVHATQNEHPELFFGCIGCYNALGVIAQAEFELEDNVRVKRAQQKMKLGDYIRFFREQVRENKDVVFHNGDIYPPRYKHVRSVSWMRTNDKPTVKTRLMPLSAAYPVERYFIGAFSRSNFGKWRREHIIDPVLYLRKSVHWRNYEAGYDVAELEPASRTKSTYVLQEYFAPVRHFDAFAAEMAEIFRRHRVNVLNVSIRHAHADPGSLLAWAREEVFAFVVYYKQGTDDAAKGKVAVWTRELTDAVISYGGTYYLPYQVHATPEQFHRAYPRAKELFALKEEYDPGFKFRNVIWDTYYQQK